MHEPIHGRGASENPANRFEKLRYAPEPEDEGASPTPRRTELYVDRSRSLIVTNDSPDVSFDASINPYRGCEHGCVYCYARPTHEYLGLSAGLDFETKILVKKNAPQLLRQELSSPRWQPTVLGLSGVTDCYQPIERHLKLTRGCLEVLAEFRNPVHIVTKNRLVVRDLDLLQELARHQAVNVFISLTTLDEDLLALLEPRTTRPAGRLQAIRTLTQAGVPAHVLVAPVIPGLNDHEIPALLTASRDAGAGFAGYTMLRLPYGVKDLFDAWLQQHRPEQREKILGRIRAVRGGKLNQTTFGDRMRGDGPIAAMIDQLFKTTVRQLQFPGFTPATTANFRRPNDTPTLLFDEAPAT